MSNPFAPAVEEPVAEASPGVRVARITLGVAAVGYVVLGVGFGALMGLLPTLDPAISREDRAVSLAMAIVMPVVCLAVAALNLAPLGGLQRRATWAWGLTFALATIYLGSICFPFGLVLVWALLNERTRKEFLGA